MSDEKEYQDQIEAGKTFVKETLKQLATDLKQADINDFTFEVTARTSTMNKSPSSIPRAGKLSLRSTKMIWRIAQRPVR